jgi:hypothetical protein
MSHHARQGISDLIEPTHCDPVAIDTEAIKGPFEVWAGGGKVGLRPRQAASIAARGYLSPSAEVVSGLPLKPINLASKFNLCLKVV